MSKINTSFAVKNFEHQVEHRQIYYKLLLTKYNTRHIFYVGSGFYLVSIYFMQTDGASVVYLHESIVNS